jgi:hypothetical protein
METKLMALNGKHTICSKTNIFNSAAEKISRLKYLESYASCETEYDTNKYMGQ